MTDDQLENALDAISGANWVWNIVQAFAILHAMGDPRCVGWTYCVSHCGRCGRCDWAISADLEGGADRARGTFGLAALAMIGQTFEEISFELERRRFAIPVPEEW